MMDKLRVFLMQFFVIPTLFGKALLLLTHNPVDFETVYRNEGIWPTRPGSETIAYHREKHRHSFFQGNDVTVKNDSFRSAVNPVLMHPKKDKLYLPKMCKINTEIVERIGEKPDPKTLEVPETFEDKIIRWTLKSVSTAGSN